MVRAWSIAYTVLALLATPAVAQELSATIRFHAEPGVAGHYYLSLPPAGGLDDVANSSLADPCDLATGSPDGLLNADDLICTIWGAGELDARHGAITVVDYLPDCRMAARTAFRTRAGGPVLFIGGAFDYRPEAGFLAVVAALAGQPLPDDTVTFTGDCEPRLPPQDVGGRCPLILNVPYDALLRDANDVLCCHEPICWWDGDPDSDPDACPDGIYDEESEAGVSVSVHVNPWDPERALVTVPQRWRRIVFGVNGVSVFAGKNFEPRAGDGLLVEFDEGHGMRPWAPAVEECP